MKDSSGKVIEPRTLLAMQLQQSRPYLLAKIHLSARSAMHTCSCLTSSSIIELLRLPTASLNNQAALEVLAVDISELDTKLVTAKEDSKLYGMVFCNTSGMA